MTPDPIYRELALEFHARRVAELVADDDARAAAKFRPLPAWFYVFGIAVAAAVLVVLAATGGTR